MRSVADSEPSGAGLADSALPYVLNRDGFCPMACSVNLCRASSEYREKPDVSMRFGIDAVRPGWGNAPGFLALTSWGNAPGFLALTSCGRVEDGPSSGSSDRSISSRLADGALLRDMFAFVVTAA